MIAFTVSCGNGPVVMAVSSFCATGAFGATGAVNGRP